MEQANLIIKSVCGTHEGHLSWEALRGKPLP